MIPRFTGHPLHSRGIAATQWWLANVGLAVMATGFTLRARGALDLATAVIAIGGVSSASAAYGFVYNLWRTIDGPRRRPSQATGTDMVVSITSRRKA